MRRELIEIHFGRMYLAYFYFGNWPTKKQLGPDYKAPLLLCSSMPFKTDNVDRCACCFSRIQFPRQRRWITIQAKVLISILLHVSFCFKGVFRKASGFRKLSSNRLENDFFFFLWGFLRSWGWVQASHHLAAIQYYLWIHFHTRMFRTETLILGKYIRRCDSSMRKSIYTFMFSISMCFVLFFFPS